MEKLVFCSIIAYRAGIFLPFQPEQTMKSLIDKAHRGYTCFRNLHDTVAGRADQCNP